MVELLAPAQNKSCAIAAINYGADAVYIGANNFGARKNAANSIEDIKEIVEYAHKFYAKVFVTINTILNNAEICQAEKLIKNLYEIGVDAIIIQDLGLLELNLPPIPIHISTQCDNRTLEKVQFFERIGVSRVILARELSLEQIKKICKNTDIELETFIHGALCVSYSGQCYLSYANGGRSANRGECAQPCRKKYTLITKNGKILAQNKHLLSLKDFNASNYLKELINVGVKSFKIEGRLKDENYIKNVVAFYRQKLDNLSQKSSSGRVFFDFTPDLNKSFNRGFTDYFLKKRNKIYNFDTPKSLGEKIGKISKIGKNYFEIETDVKLHPQDGLCYLTSMGFSGCLVNKIEGNKIYPNKSEKLSLGTEIFRNSDVEFEKKLSTSKTKRKIKVDIAITRSSIQATDEDNNSVILELEFKELAKNQQKMKENFEIQLKKSGESYFYIDKITFTNENLSFLTISKINEIRRNILEKLMEERLKNYKKEIQKPLRVVDFPEKTKDYHANVYNDLAGNFYKKCNCEILEIALENGLPIKNKELMRTKHCLKFAFNMCQSSETLYLVDEKGTKYNLEFDCKNCEMIIKPSI